jgi:hypothetical protein
MKEPLETFLFRLNLADAVTEKCGNANWPNWIRGKSPAEVSFELKAKIYLRYAIDGRTPLREILHAATNNFDDDHLKTFVRSLGIALGRGVKKPLLDRVDSVIEFLRRGCWIKEFEGRGYPPLPRWAGPAAHQRVAFYLWRLAGLEELPSDTRYVPTYEAYRKRVKRMRLDFKSERPILVTKAKFDQSQGTLQVAFAPGVTTEEKFGRNTKTLQLTLARG